MSSNAFVWSDCVADFSDQDVCDLAKVRGFRLETLKWMRENEEIGKYYVPKAGWCVAFPVRDASGEVYRCHCREPKGFKYQPYDPLGSDISVMMLGDLGAIRYHVHEGEWDGIAQISALNLESEIDGTVECVIATRGAQGASRLADIAFPAGAQIYLYPQNDKPSRNGKTASDEWLAACLEALGEALVVKIPAEHKDLNDWIRAPEFTFDQLEAAITAAVLQKRSDGFPEIIRGDIMQASEAMPLPNDIIKGLLAHGEKGVLAGGSKSFKTWALLHQALAIASGTEWWGIPTPKNNALFLNLELPPEYIDNRIRTIAFAMGIEIPDTFHLWNLRRERLGDEKRWEKFLEALTARCLAIPRPFVTSDPIYKLLGGRNENSAGDVGTLLEQLDDVVDLTHGSNFFGHHFSKGSQADKEAIDRASGSGVFQRDPDTILTMTPLKKPGAFGVELIVRNHEPIDPFAVEWKCPLFERNPLLDPTDLKPKRRPGNAQRFDVHMIIAELETAGRPLTASEWCEIMAQEMGMKEWKFYELKAEAHAAGLIRRDKTDPRKWVKK